LFVALVLGSFFVPVGFLVASGPGEPPLAALARALAGD
jgi:hypothetical protein